MANRPQLPPALVVRPDPDPTILTTQQLQREVSAIKELFAARLDAMDKAISLLQSNADKQPSIAVVDQTLRGLKELTEGQFHRVDVLLIEREKRALQAGDDSRLALINALSAQKEAVDKSEINFTKSIDQIGVRINDLVKSTDDKMQDVKDRVTVIESRTKGISDSWGYLVGLFGVLAAGASVIALFMSRGVP